MAVSQKQIAKKLGVSIALVSRVLSGKAAEIGIAPETIERVLKTAQEMGYVPSAAALALKGKSTRTFGVVVYDFKDPFFGAIIEQLQMRAHEYDYSLMLAGFLNRTPDEQDLQPLHKHALDGLIVIGTDLDAVWLRDFEHLPVARIGHGAPSEPSVRIAIDENRSAELLVSHLIQSGHENLAFIAAALTAHRLRREAIAQAAKKAGVHFEFIEADAQDAFQAGMDAANQLSQRTDAIICATDQVAMGVLHTLSHTDRIPAVTGFDDIAVARQFIPGITTIRQPIAAMAVAAVDAVVQKKAPARLSLEPELVVRQSAS
ncbi:LacI family DNA-binding transcriptional regulator [Tichowtungia aerotolerans]|uniref:Substrate-binding domain-containing protein n=1 Tax=Tichowtungia aerotolerans TaxID=2697043 RepID=A0A6P1M2I1_9BACT|nr:LacI family DNA-binding transcriptional regulator [Tichowtungia aerotolerans]QHI68800.1 substrate-binding domain-containing protein [Tichowtungia aerotolerans]